jgi:3-deoxy-D-manno-octulosonate 8-phosphate phosphatase (KDO 8-P phosphatase)
MASAKIQKKCRKIKLLVTDVDCVLTDGGMYYTAQGDFMKKFHTRDGMGVSLLKKNNIFTVIVTKEKTKVVKKWAKKMSIKKLYDGILKKESVLDDIKKTFDLTYDQIAYIGDDVNDLELMRSVGFSATPNDAVILAKNIADYVCISKGGDGVLREVADLILNIQHPNKTTWY